MEKLDFTKILDEEFGNLFEFRVRKEWGRRFESGEFDQVFASSFCDCNCF